MTSQPPGVALMIRRREAAVAWRRDHVNHPDREVLWAAYVEGAATHSRLTRMERAIVRAALAAAERLVPWPEDES
jgi:hypothetical protein